MKEIIYVGNYSLLNSNQERNAILSAVNKMNYIVKVLDDNKIKVTVLSLSGSSSSKKYSKLEEKMYNNSKVILFSTIGTGCGVKRKLQRLLIKIAFTLYMLKHTNKNSCVIVYHSLVYMNLIKVLHKVKKFKLILEIEELYGDVLMNSRIKNREIIFTKKADGFIFPTNFLNCIINKHKVPFSIIHGTYQVEKEKIIKNNDGIIHVVYAGTLEKRKGSLEAAKVARFLDSRFHIHIIGFGSSEEVKEIEALVDEIAKEAKCILTFDGLKKGEEYIRFLQMCDIGLCTQDPKASFSNTSFPSKILSYMANGLRVVSIRIPAIEESDVGEYLYYYDEQTPESIADTIRNIDFKDCYDGRKIICDLNTKFEEDILKLI